MNEAASPIHHAREQQTRRLYQGWREFAEAVVRSGPNRYLSKGIHRMLVQLQELSMVGFAASIK